jgi:hypothetical protein
VGVHASRSVVRTRELPGHVRRLKRATVPRRATETPRMQASGGAPVRIGGIATHEVGLISRKSLRAISSIPKVDGMAVISAINGLYSKTSG